jgi:hypothetical protein
MRLKQWAMAWLAASVIGLAAGTAGAQTKGADGGAVEEQIRARMQELMNARPDSVTRTPTTPTRTPATSWWAG